MKIADSSILLGSQRTYTEKFEEHTDFRFWINPMSDTNTDQVNISREARACAGCESRYDEDILEGTEFEVSLERLITEILSGRKVRVLRTEDITREQEVDASAGSARAEESGQNPQGWGLDYSHETVYQEKEAVSFDARGIVRTTDGRELDFTLCLDMSREYVERNSIHIQAGDALKDPLIINFDGTAAQLGKRTFRFDIDADGRDDSLPELSKGKGYLAIDLNGDGVINDGSELFGPSTGDGFEELTLYDTDGNGWIDESDAAYRSLSVLSFDEAGDQVLQAIKDRGIGAILTSSSQTQFDIKARLSGELLGRVRSSGIYLAENGTVGTIQQIDIKV